MPYFYHFESPPEKETILRTGLAGLIDKMYTSGEVDAVFFEEIKSSETPLKSLFVQDYPSLTLTKQIDFPVYGADDPELQSMHDLVFTTLYEFIKKTERLGKDILIPKKKDKNPKKLERRMKKLKALNKEAREMIKQEKKLRALRAEYMVDHSAKVAHRMGYVNIGLVCAMLYRKDVQERADKHGYTYVLIPTPLF